MGGTIADPWTAGFGDVDATSPFSILYPHCIITYLQLHSNYDKTRKFRSTRKFDKQYRGLEQRIQKQATKTIELFMQDHTHPSLRFKKVQGTLISSRSKNTLYIIGKHEEVLG